MENLDKESFLDTAKFRSFYELQERNIIGYNDMDKRVFVPVVCIPDEAE